MTHDHAHQPNFDHQPAVDLADEAVSHVAAYIAAFNTGSAEALDQVYEEQAAVVPRPDHPATGQSD